MPAPPVPIPFPLSSAPGSQPQESAGRLINLVAEPLGPTAGARQAWHRAPGLTLEAVSGLTGYRGGILANSLIYAAIGAFVVSVDSSHNVSVIGALAGTDPCIFAHNNKQPTADIVVVNGNGAFLVLDTHSVQPDITLPANALSGGDLAGSPKEQAFSGNNGTNEWLSSQVGTAVVGAAYLGQNFGATRNVVAMGVFQANNGIGNINSATVQHSPDGVTWTDVQTFNLNAPGALQMLTWASVGAFQYWRLLANDNPGTGVSWGVYALSMYLAATTAGPTVTAYPGGILPSPNSVCFQDGYFFFSIGDRRVFASNLNDIPINALTYTTLQGRPSQAGVRVIAYKGVLFAFTTSSCEIWQDTAQGFPGFPYSRLAVVDRGLLSSAAIAGDTEGFGSLLWVGDDFGVYRFQDLQPQKVSPPDLDRLIEAQAKIDPTKLFAGCYIAGGRSMWTLSSPNWTWEFNCVAEKWNERSSFYSGLLSRWRGIGGLRAFGRWIVGDDQTGNLAAVDPTNFTELGTPQLFRLESGPVENFPNRIRVGRIDVDLAAGAGQSAGTSSNAIDPQIMISWSDDGGVHWVAPISRNLGEQARASQRIWAVSLGRTGAQGRRWRLDVSDPVYVGILGATMNANARAW